MFLILGEWHVAHIEPVKVENGKSDVVKVQFEREVEWLFRGSPRFYQVLRHFRPGTEVEYPGWYGEVETRNRGMLLDEEYQENCLASCVGFEGVINVSVGLNLVAFHRLLILRTYEIVKILVSIVLFFHV